MIGIAAGNTAAKKKNNFNPLFVIVIIFLLSELNSFKSGIY